MLQLAVFALLSALSAPDVLLPGQSAVVHELVARPSAGLEGHVLIATPSAGFGGVHIVEPGEPFRFSGKYGTKLYLVPKTEDLAAIKAPSPQDSLDYPSSNPPVSEISSVASSHPLRRVLTTFEVVGVEGDRLELAALGTEEFGSGGKPLEGGRSVAPWIFLGAAGLAIGAVLLAKRSRPSAVDAS